MAKPKVNTDSRVAVTRPIQNHHVITPSINKLLTDIFVVLFLLMRKCIHHLLRVPHLWFFFVCFKGSARLADDSSVFVVICHLKYKDEPDSCICRIETQPKTNQYWQGNPSYIGFEIVYIWYCRSHFIVFIWELNPICKQL